MPRAFGPWQRLGDRRIGPYIIVVNQASGKFGLLEGKEGAGPRRDGKVERTFDTLGAAERWVDDLLSGEEIDALAIETIGLHAVAVKPVQVRWNMSDRRWVGRDSQSHMKVYRPTDEQRAAWDAAVEEVARTRQAYYLAQSAERKIREAMEVEPPAST